MGVLIRLCTQVGFNVDSIDEKTDIFVDYL